jgi:hypothetical protein
LATRWRFNLIFNLSGDSGRHSSNDLQEWQMISSEKRLVAFALDRKAMMRMKTLPVSIKIVVIAFALVLLVACERDSEAELRSKLGQWFFLGETAYFDSQPRCTGAMFHVNLDRPRASIAVHTSVDRVKDALHVDGLAAIQIDGMTPADLTDALRLNGGDAFGKHAIAAGALAGACFKGVGASDFLYEALNRPGATLAYDMKSAGLMVFDSDQKRLFYIAGDAW